MATAIPAIGSALVSVFSKILHAGHADDAAGEADGKAATDLLGPILAEILGRQVAGTGTYQWMDPATDEVAHLEEQDRWPLTAYRTAQLIDAGQAYTDQVCQQLAQAGYPCHSYVAGKSGAGTLLFEKWGRLKAFLQLGLNRAQDREARMGGPPAAVNPGTPSYYANASTGLAAQGIPSNGVGGGSAALQAGIFGIPLTAGSSTGTWFFLGAITLVLLFIFLWR